MDIDEAVGRASAWERVVYRVLSTDPAEDLDEALRWYEELASASFDPAVDLHLTILEGEAGRLDRVRRRTEEWERRGDPLPAFARLVGAAYLGEDVEGEAGPDADAALADALEPGWFRDRLATRLATRLGDQNLLTAATAAQAERSSRLLARMRVTVAIEVVLIGLGFVLLARVVWRRRALDRVSVVVLPPPWPGRTGIRVLIWGGALGAITLTVLYVASSFGPDRPYSRVLIGAATNLSFVPLIALASRYLIRPSGLRLSESFGLVPTPDGARRLVLVVLTLLALGQVGEGVIDLAGRWLGLSAHWTEWFDRDLVWGSRTVVGLTVFDTVVLTAPAVRRGQRRRAERRHLRRRSRLRRPRVRGRLLERPPVGVGVRADGQPAPVDGGARRGQSHGLAVGDPGAAWLAATSGNIAANAIRPRRRSPSAAPARPGAAGSSSTNIRRAGSTTICGWRSTGC